MIQTFFLKIQNGNVFCSTEERCLCVDLFDNELVLLDRNEPVEKIRTKLVRDE